MSVREAPQYRDGVVADREYRDTGVFESGMDLLQLDQLRLTVGSPIGTAVEQDEGPSARPRRVQIDGRPRLVG